MRRRISAASNPRLARITEMAVNMNKARKADGPRSVECSTCHAKPGSPCKRPSGHTVFGGGFHAPRIALFESKGGAK